MEIENDKRTHLQSRASRHSVGDHNLEQTIMPTADAASMLWRLCSAQVRPACRDLPMHKAQELNRADISVLLAAERSHQSVIAMLLREEMKKNSQGCSPNVAEQRPMRTGR